MERSVGQRKYSCTNILHVCTSIVAPLADKSTDKDLTTGSPQLSTEEGQWDFVCGRKSFSIINLVGGRGGERETDRENEQQQVEVVSIEQPTINGVPTPLVVLYFSLTAVTMTLVSPLWKITKISTLKIKCYGHDNEICTCAKIAPSASFTYFPAEKVRGLQKKVLYNTWWALI